MTVFGYLGAALTVGFAFVAYSALGGGPGAAILAIGVLRFGTAATLVVALLALGFAWVEVRESPVRTLPNVATVGAATVVFLLLLLFTIRLWFF